MLDTYVPNVLRQRLAEQTSDAERIDEAISGAVLFVDVAGYTKITEKLGAAGADGAERMLALLDQHFERVTSIILAHGGDVQLFAGDAALALWPAASDLESAIHAAAQCALAIRDSLHRRTPVDGISLTLRAGIGAGPLRLLEVGGYQGNRFALLEGEPITQAGDASEEAAPGDVALSPVAAALLGQRAEYAAARNGYSILSSVAARDIQPTAQVADVPSVVLEDFVPQIVRERLRAGHQDWLAEFRRASILFVDLSGRNVDSTAEAIRRDIYQLQKITARYGGLVYQVLMDDKGLTFVAAFGLPSLNSEHAPVRAVEAATAMRQTLESTGAPCAIGVATGRTFCGASGGSQRRQYSVFGSAINLAARLMQTSNGTVLVDHSTQLQAGAKIVFERCGVRQLKGFDQAVDLYTPTSLDSAAHREQVQRLVGRKSESAVIANKIDELRQGRGAIVWIEGEAGIGKSHFVGGLIASAESQGVAVYSGEGDAIENVTSLFGWRRILSSMLELSADNVAETRSLVEQMLADDADLLQRVSLLNEVLPLDFPETEESLATRGEKRADWMQSLVAKIVESVADAKPMMITIDDAHWLDSGSFELFASITRRCSQVLLLMASRPLEEPAATIARRMLDAPRAEKLILDRFPIEDLDSLLAYWLSVRAVPAALTSFVMERAEGHPFHSEEILTELLESGAITIDGDVCRITTGDGNLLSARIPDSVQGVVASRIDRLPVVEQLMLKAASVVGRTFAFDLLRDIYPLTEDAKKLDQGLEHLEAVDLVRLEATEPTRSYVFKHAIVRDVAYETLPFERRRSLHRSVADWYEINRGDKTRTLAPLLAHHWDIAGEPVKAVPYLEQAGQDAVESFSNREAIGFLERARSLTSEHQLAVADLRVANWESLLGEAHIQISDHVGAEKHLRRSLELFGAPVAGSNWQMGLAFAGEAVKRMLGKLRIPESRLDNAEQTRLQRASHDMKRYSETAFMNNKQLAVAYGILRCANLAEACGWRTGMVDGYASLGVVTGLARMHKLAESFFVRSQQLAEQDSAPNDFARTRILYSVGVADWPAALAAAAGGREMHGREGARYLWETCRSAEGNIYILMGRFDEATECHAEAFHSAQYGALQSRLFARAGQMARALSTRGQVEPELVNDYALQLRYNEQRTEETVGYGLLAWAALRDGHDNEAKDLATRSLRLMRKAAPNLYYTLWSIAGTIEVFMHLARIGGGSDSRMMRLAQESVTVMRRFAWMVPMAGPRAALYRGRLALLKGKPRRATRILQAGLAQAKRFQMPYDEALLELELGRYFSARDGVCHPLLLAAETNLNNLGARYDQELARQAITDSQSQVGGTAVNS